jgi:hypothetical protein
MIYPVNILAFPGRSQLYTVCIATSADYVPLPTVAGELSAVGNAQSPARSELLAVSGEQSSVSGEFALVGSDSVAACGRPSAGSGALFTGRIMASAAGRELPGVSIFAFGA